MLPSAAARPTALFLCLRCLYGISIGVLIVGAVGQRDGTRGLYVLSVLVMVRNEANSSTSSDQTDNVLGRLRYGRDVEDCAQNRETHPLEF